MAPAAADRDLTPAVLARLARLQHGGELSEADAAHLGCRLIATSHGAETAVDHIRLALAVDAGGAVRAVRLRTNAGGALLAAYDAMAELCLGRPLTELATITPRQVEAALRKAASDPGPALTLGDDADQPFYVLRKAAERAHSQPAPAPATGTTAQLPWNDCGLFEKVRRIETVLDANVRPALASDGGGIDLVDLKGDELFVQYHGACGSCSSSIGGTLQFIQDSLNNNLGTSLAVRVTGAEEHIPLV